MKIVFICFFIILLIIVLYLVIITCGDIYYSGFAVPRYHFRLNQRRYMLQKENRIDLQKNLECSGYSSAYLLRYCGIKADGAKVYEKIPGKMKNGCVYPKSIPQLLSTYGISAGYYKGNLNSLMNTLAKGYPVIVLIRYQRDKNWLHYVPIVGYDEEYIYAADSLQKKVNCEDNNIYNRKIPISEFKQLWNTSMLVMPFYSNTYIAIKENK